MINEFTGINNLRFCVSENEQRNASSNFCEALYLNFLAILYLTEHIELKSGQYLFLFMTSGVSKVAF